jgi:2-haloacid dehalogenase
VQKAQFQLRSHPRGGSVGAYKPDSPHFHTAIADLAARGIPREWILHVGQSLRADITPANKLGLKCAWINR